MFLHTGQDFLPGGRLSEKTGKSHGTGHRTKDHEEILLPFCCGHSRHERYPLISEPFYPAGNFLSKTEFGASNLRR